MKPVLAIASLAALVAFVAPARADFASCVASLRADASAKGVSDKTLAAAFDKLQPDPKVLDFETNQPEFKTPIWDYMAGLVDDERVADGKAAMAREAGALAKAEARFGVDKYVLAAIWGVESNFGENTGGRPLVQSLSTLACQSDVRPAYYRGELMAALKIVDRGDIPLDKLTGSWAGAFGQTQFMPSTFLRLAVDLDGSGRDIVDNPAAALGSTANYLSHSGWRDRRAVGFRGQAARRLFRAVRPQGQGADGELGGARDQAHRRQAARRGRRRPAAAGRARRGRRSSSRRTSTSSTATTPPNPTRWRSPSSPSASPAARASSRPGRPTTPACRAPSGANCRRCSPNTATTSAPPTARSAPRPRRRSPISRARTG